MKLDLTTKEVEVYVYTEPNGVHEVAMIFEFPKDRERLHEPEDRSLSGELSPSATGPNASSTARPRPTSTAVARWLRRVHRRRFRESQIGRRARVAHQTE